LDIRKDLELFQVVFGQASLLALPERVKAPEGTGAADANVLLLAVQILFKVSYARSVEPLFAVVAADHEC
jgi:hypothetical protein